MDVPSSRECFRNQSIVSDWLDFANKSRQLVRTVDFKEPRLLLLVLAELQLVHIVLQAEFFEGDGDLVAVGGCSKERLAGTPEGLVSTRCVSIFLFFSSVWKPIVERIQGDRDGIDILPAVYKSMLVLGAMFAEDGSVSCREWLLVWYRKSRFKILVLKEY